MESILQLISSRPNTNGALRILVGATDSGKHAIFISGTREGLRLLADIIRARADAPDNEFCKLLRENNQLPFTTSDSVDIFEIHTTEDAPEVHPERGSFNGPSQQS